MTKKRLGTCYGRGAEVSDPETEAIQEAAPDQPLEPDTTLSETEPTIYETTDEQLQVNTAALQAKRIPTKAELETTVSELRSPERISRQGKLYSNKLLICKQTYRSRKMLQKLLAEPADQSDQG